jgi:hypothetical protein
LRRPKHSKIEVVAPKEEEEEEEEEVIYLCHTCVLDYLMTLPEVYKSSCNSYNRSPPKKNNSRCFGQT